MNPLARLFHRTLPPPAQPRDNEGRFLPQRIAVRRKAIELATEKGRHDLIQRLTGEPNCPPLPPETADATSAQSVQPSVSSAGAGQGSALGGANDRNVAISLSGEMK